MVQLILIGSLLVLILHEVWRANIIELNLVWRSWLDGWNHYSLSRSLLHLEHVGLVLVLKRVRPAHLGILNILEQVLLVLEVSNSLNRDLTLFLIDDSSMLNHCLLLLPKLLFMLQETPWGENILDSVIGLS